MYVNPAFLFPFISCFLIDDRVGLAIGPEDVRLQPQPEDSYAWAIMEPKAALLKSSLRSGTLDLYQSICNELGHTLEAVPPQELQNSESGVMATHDVSFYMRLLEGYPIE